MRIASTATTRAGEAQQRADAQRVVEPVQERRELASRCADATIAPITAIPSEPPTWRDEFSTAEPTPALSTGTALIAAAVVGVIVKRHPDAADQQPGQDRPEALVRAELRVVEEHHREQRHAAADEPARADRSVSAPARGAIRMIRIVIGRKLAPACTGE